MFRTHVALGIGLWLIAVSLLGIPSIWKIRLYVATGAVFIVIYLFHLVRATIFAMARQPESADTFTENRASAGSTPTAAANE